MNAKYRALLALITLPVVLYVVATSGIPDRIDVEEIGARKEQNDRTKTMRILRVGEKRRYCSASTSWNSLATGISWWERWLCTRSRSFVPIICCDLDALVLIGSIGVEPSSTLDMECVDVMVYTASNAI